MATNSVTFATIASRGYIDQAAGLALNISEFYPEAVLEVCALDERTKEVLGSSRIPNIRCVAPETVWGSAHWYNMSCRMTMPERAFATKSALAVWTLETQRSPILLLDSDLLFLSKIDDIVESLTSHAMLLVPGRHPWQHWRKTAKFGLFSAGIIGFSPDAIAAVRAWRAMCFEACMAMPFANLYYEQKYLNYFVSQSGLRILDDTGINVSQTLMKLLAPRRNPDGAWVVGDDTPLRIYHASRSTDEDLELARIKVDYNKRGLDLLGMSERAGPREQKAGGGIGFAAIVRMLRIGSLLDALSSGLESLSRWLVTAHRVLTLPDHSLRERVAQAGASRRRLLSELEREAYQPRTDPGSRDAR